MGTDIKTKLLQLNEKTILMSTPFYMGAYGRKRVSRRMGFDLELRCPLTNLSKKITRDPKWGLVSLDFFSCVCVVFSRLGRAKP